MATGGPTSRSPSWPSRVHDLAVGLIDLGVQAGDRVSVLADTRFEWTVVDLAISACGAVVVPIYASNSPKECAWVLGDSGAAGRHLREPDRHGQDR